MLPWSEFKWKRVGDWAGFSAWIRASLKCVHEDAGLTDHISKWEIGSCWKRTGLWRNNEHTANIQSGSACSLEKPGLLDLYIHEWSISNIY